MSSSPSLPSHLLRRDERPSDLTLERYLLGELSTSEVQILEEMLQNSPELLQRVDAMRQFDEASSTQRKPPPYLLEQARQRSRQDHTRTNHDQVNTTLGQRLSSILSSGWGWAAVGVAIIATLLPLIGQHLPGGNNEQDQTRDLRGLYSQNSHHGRTRAKGGSTVWEIYRAPESQQNRRQSIRLKEGAVIHPGQRIGFRLYPKRQGHYMIIGRDSTQTWYLGAPQPNPRLALSKQPTQAIPSLSEGVTSIDLNEALEFDSQLGREELFLFFCQEPTVYGTLHAALVSHDNEFKLPEQLAQIKLPSQCKLSFISLDKKAR